MFDEIWPMFSMRSGKRVQKRVNLVDLDKSFQTSIDYLLTKFGFFLFENRTTSDSDPDTAERYASGTFSF